MYVYKLLINIHNNTIIQYNYQAPPISCDPKKKIQTKQKIDGETKITWMKYKAQTKKYNKI